MLVIAVILVIGGGLMAVGGCIEGLTAAPLDNRPAPFLIGGLVMFVGGWLLGIGCEIRERLDKLASKLIGDESTGESPPQIEPTAAPQTQTPEPIVCPRCRKQTTANKKKCPRCGWLLAPSLDGSLADFE